MELSRLKEGNEDIVQDIDVLIDNLKRIEAYMFSRKVRPILFQLSAPYLRENAVNEISGMIRSYITQDMQSIYQKTSRHIADLKKENKIFRLSKHEEKAISYGLSSLGHQSEAQKSLFRITDLLAALKENDSDFKSMQLSFHSIRDEFKRLFDYLDDARIYIADFQGRARIDEYLAQTETEFASKNLFTEDNWGKMQPGDIWISFKTKNFLKNETVSRWISRLTNSQVTHVALFLRNSKGEECFINADAKAGAPYEILPVNPIKGVVFAVLRPRLTPDQRMMLWAAVRKKLENKVVYSKRKKFIGVILLIIIDFFAGFFSKKHIRFGNVFGSAKAGLFCSEFLNEVFKDVGFMLTPKSKDSSTVFPSDIAASPNVDFIGVGFDPHYVERGDMSISEMLYDVKI